MRSSALVFNHRASAWMLRGMNEMCGLSLLHPRDILKHLKLPEKQPEAYSDMNRLLPSTEDALNSAGATLLPRR